MATRHQARESIIGLLYAEDIGNAGIDKFIDELFEEKKIRNQQKEFAQVADKLATMFAEAYQLISQFKSGLDAQPEPQQQPQRTAQPAMQILRPEAVNAENFYPRR